MGCATSKETGVLGRGHQSPPIAPEPTQVEDDGDSKRPEALLSAAASSKAVFNTHTTQASSFYGFKGGGRSLASLGSTADNARSEGGSELGSVSVFSSSSKERGAYGGFGGEKLSELDNEEEFEEDFEDFDEKQPTPSAAKLLPGAERPGGLAPLKPEASPSVRLSDVGAPAPVARCALCPLHILSAGVFVCVFLSICAFFCRRVQAF